MAGLVRMDAITGLEEGMEEPIDTTLRGIEEKVARFSASRFTRNLELTLHTHDEMRTARRVVLSHGLMHNIPRVNETSPRGLSREQSIDIQGFYCWKPQPREKEMIAILVAFKDDASAEEYHFSPEFDAHERFIGHYVADMMDLCHLSINTPSGRMLCVWKTSASDFIVGHADAGPPHPLLATGSSGPALGAVLPSPMSATSASSTESDVSAMSFGRVDTWDGGFGASIGSMTPTHHSAPLPGSFYTGGGPPKPAPLSPPQFRSLSSVSEVPEQGGASPGDFHQDLAPFQREGDENDRGVGRGGSGGGEHPQGVFVPPTSPLEGAKHPSLSKQASVRVERETRELESKINQPAQPMRITTGTGEVYTVMDRGTGSRAIFKPAVQHSQAERKLFRDFGASLSSGDEFDRSSGDGASPTSTTGTASDARSSPAPGGDGEEHQAVDKHAHRKEVAAYLLDHYGFAGVLPTIEAKVDLQGEPQAGMIQQFLEHEETADEDEWGRRQINALRARDVHMVGALDVRLFNCDRHGGNLLLDRVKAGNGDQGGSDGAHMRLVPIDHELTLPSWRSLENANFCWMTWSQARKPFDKEAVSYIKGLDLKRDVAILRDLSIPPESIATYRICLTFLKACVAHGLCLWDIGNMVMRDPALDYEDEALDEIPEWPTHPSVLEELVQRAVDAHTEPTPLPDAANDGADGNDDSDDGGFSAACEETFAKVVAEYLDSKFKAAPSAARSEASLATQGSS